MEGPKLKVNEPPDHQRSNTLKRAYHKFERFWHRIQIGHQSEYSVERLHAFRDYYEQTSSTRALAVCILTPIPAVINSDSDRLYPVGASFFDGWRANYALWGRLLLDAFGIAVGVAAQVQQVIIEGVISDAKGAGISLVSALTYVALAIALAATWKFPIPFGYILLVGPFVVIFWVYTIAAIGPGLTVESAVLRQQIKALLLIIIAQGIVAISYPIFTAIFYRLSGVEQTAFVFVMPLIKFVTKQIIADAAESLHEYVGPIVVFSVDVFNIFYVAICMQISKSPVATLLMIVSDSFHVVVALRTIFRQANVKKVNSSVSLKITTTFETYHAKWRLYLKTSN